MSYIIGSLERSNELRASDTKALLTSLAAPFSRECAARGHEPDQSGRSGAVQPGLAVPTLGPAGAHSTAPQKTHVSLPRAPSAPDPPVTAATKGMELEISAPDPPVTAIWKVRTLNIRSSVKMYGPRKVWTATHPALH